MQPRAQVLSASACASPEPVLTRVRRPLSVSATKTSLAPLVSPTTSASAVLAKTTKRPSAETAPTVL